MPRIIHDGAAQLADLMRDLPEEVGPRELHFLLRRYFDDARTGEREGEGPPAEDYLAGLEAWLEEVERAVFGPVGDYDDRRTWPIFRVDDLRARVARDARARVPPGQAPPPPRRIFVSHRQADHDEARKLARHILLHGRFDVWLDVWDPLLRLVGRLPLDPRRRALLTALIIEMGLMNARAVIALMTSNSRGSAWIPYEYGRVKQGGPFAESAAAAVSAAAVPDAELQAFELGILHGRSAPPAPDLPEYMRLGPAFPWDEVRLLPTALRSWLDQL